MTTRQRTEDVGTVAQLLPSWRISLLARNLSPNTLATYLSAVEMFDAYLAER